MGGLLLRSTSSLMEDALRGSTAARFSICFRGHDRREQ